MKTISIIMLSIIIIIQFIYIVWNAGKIEQYESFFEIQQTEIYRLKNGTKKTVEKPFVGMPVE